MSLILDSVKITQSTLGTSETGRSSELGIYPNPVSDYVYVKSGSKMVKAEIFDWSGRKIKTASGDHKIDVRSRQPGTYLVRITTENTTYSQKIIKK
ncbi:MAG: T9SS type A sorting domain-containing protein [Chryseobacterium sp.]|uniref:T9SS type A sorting domain-containing protein n=1 Tax=Chryseobacterium sp. TaxID=1871047 RepID=UPI0025C53A0C|nr:T9SS type A sorting domain-containing protein [Chryseobacterium sp.]MCJ7932098.1 T9SS type A sorting domain-containing protein [Chryseobacterium sp.]